MAAAMDSTPCPSFSFRVANPCRKSYKATCLPTCLAIRLDLSRHAATAHFLPLRLVKIHSGFAAARRFDDCSRFIIQVDDPCPFFTFGFFHRENNPVAPDMTRLEVPHLEGPCPGKPRESHQIPEMLVGAFQDGLVFHLGDGCFPPVCLWFRDGRAGM